MGIKWYCPYKFTLAALGLFLLFAFLMDSPAEIGRGLLSIYTSRSSLTTDYFAVGGVGAAFVNAVLVGAACVLLLMLVEIAPNGSTIMAIWLSVGFSFYGKNLFNMAPIVLGVFLYSRFQKEHFLNYSLNAVLASTLAPVVSEVANLSGFGWSAMPFLGVLAGVAVGFVMPVISSVVTRIHGGYNLYNVGFAGGVVAIFLMAGARSLGVEQERPFFWSDGDKLPLAIFLYIFLLGWIALGLASGKRESLWPNLRKMWGHSGRLVSDYYLLYKESCYVNMGMCGLLGLTVTLLMQAALNGATLAGIFTMMAFGAFGKHWKNCLPVMLGAVALALINPAPPHEAANIVPILFCTGLAPIAGQFGWRWGIVAGAMHMAVHNHINSITGGLNLYNNGFSAGFVALVLVPLIMAFRKGRDLNEAKI